jgi:hypothetical protein
MTAVSHEATTVPDDRFTQPVLTFIERSPLADCTTTGYDGGRHVVRTDRPLLTLSTGEQRLWTFLRSLVAGDVRSLLEHADQHTLGAVADLFNGIAYQRPPTGYQAPGVETR